MTTIGDANDPATVKTDADTFFLNSGYFAATDAAEAQGIAGQFDGVHKPGYWGIGQMTAALAQMVDLVAPLDLVRATTYLSRLGAIAGALLANRDDKRGFPVDPFRGRVMPAWGGIANDRDCKWNTDVSTSGLFVYAMAAFARRVLDWPAQYPQFENQAVALVTAALETYQAFRPELHFVDADPHAFYNLPLAYASLTCASGLHCADGTTSNAHGCEGYRAGAGQPIAYNENLAMVQALAELARAADSAAYRTSGDATPQLLQLATVELPLVVAKVVAYRVADFSAQTLSDGTPYTQWHYQGTDRPENTPHAQFELGCLAVILDAQVRIDALLARAGRPERVPLDPSLFVRLANTFLRIVWRQNDLAGEIDGSGGPGFNVECAGWIPLAQFDPWVWRRSRDTVFHPNPPTLRVDNHAALLRYRRFNAMKFLTTFAGQNWLIVPAALAVGQAPPQSITQQKWLLVLSGVVIADQRGDNSGGWNQQTVSFEPDMAGLDVPGATSGPLNWAIAQYGIPRPTGVAGRDYLVRFALDEWSPFVSLSAIFDQAQSINAGYAVNVWRPNAFGSGTDIVTKQPVGNLFSGVNADLAVSDSDAWIYRLGYNITLLGRIVFIAPPVIE
jgi:hypothetical protein